MEAGHSRLPPCSDACSPGATLGGRHLALSQGVSLLFFPGRQRGNPVTAGKRRVSSPVLEGWARREIGNTSSTIDAKAPVKRWGAGESPWRPEVGMLPSQEGITFAESVVSVSDPATRATARPLVHASSRKGSAAMHACKPHAVHLPQGSGARWHTAGRPAACQRDGRVDPERDRNDPHASQEAAQRRRHHRKVMSPMMGGGRAAKGKGEHH